MHQFTSQVVQVTDRVGDIKVLPFVGADPTCTETIYIAVQKIKSSYSHAL